MKFILLSLICLLSGCATLAAGADKYEKFCETHPLICGGNRPVIINGPNSPPIAPIIVNH